MRSVALNLGRIYLRVAFGHYDVGWHRQPSYLVIALGRALVMILVRPRGVRAWGLRINRARRAAHVDAQRVRSA